MPFAQGFEGIRIGPQSCASGMALQGQARQNNEHGLRVFPAVVLLVATLQAWTGDPVNGFSAPAGGAPAYPFSMGGFLQGVTSLGGSLLFHATEGATLFVLSIVVVAVSFRWSSRRSVRICACLAAVSILVAGLGGCCLCCRGSTTEDSRCRWGEASSACTPHTS